MGSSKSGWKETGSGDMVKGRRTFPAESKQSDLFQQVVFGGDVDKALAESSLIDTKEARRRLYQGAAGAQSPWLANHASTFKFHMPYSAEAIEELRMAHRKSSKTYLDSVSRVVFGQDKPGSVKYKPADGKGRPDPEFEGRAGLISAELDRLNSPENLANESGDGHLQRVRHNGGASLHKGSVDDVVYGHDLDGSSNQVQTEDLQMYAGAAGMTSKQVAATHPEATFLRTDGIARASVSAVSPNDCDVDLVVFGHDIDQKGHFKEELTDAPAFQGSFGATTVNLAQRHPDLHFDPERNPRAAQRHPDLHFDSEGNPRAVSSSHTGGHPQLYTQGRRHVDDTAAVDQTVSHVREVVFGQPGEQPERPRKPTQGWNDNAAGMSTDYLNRFTHMDKTGLRRGLQQWQMPWYEHADLKGGHVLAGRSDGKMKTDSRFKGAAGHSTHDINCRDPTVTHDSRMLKEMDIAGHVQSVPQKHVENAASAIGNTTGMLDKHTHFTRKKRVTPDQFQGAFGATTHFINQNSK